MRWVALTLSGSLAACQNSSSDTLLLQKAQQTADMPECASLRVIDASQGRVDDEYNFRMTADFAASRQCLDEWKKQVDAGHWHRDHHGWWFDSSARVTVSFDRGSGSVGWHQNYLQSGVRHIPTAIDAHLRAGGAK